MRIHILGICGTFMAGIALIVRQLGHVVTGADAQFYPPMGQQLKAENITLVRGYAAKQIDHVKPECILVGNALSRGTPVVERMLRDKLLFAAAPPWLWQNLLCQRHVIAVAGTHGKTSVASMMAWVLEEAGQKPGFLIGGIPENFGVSARVGQSPYFVIEADEYDTAFFDKRAKFIHYRPSTLIITNMEYDHADIYADMAMIRREFHHLLRTLPDNGLVVCDDRDTETMRTLDMGCWTPVERVSYVNGWQVVPMSRDFSAFRVMHAKTAVATVTWPLLGQHNATNALTVFAACEQLGIHAPQVASALEKFRGVTRRLQLLDTIAGIALYDDFAHHPTAISASLNALKARAAPGHLVAIFEPRSNTMRMGVHQQDLARALGIADRVYIRAEDDLSWDIDQALDDVTHKRPRFKDNNSLLAALASELVAEDHVIVMSNGDCSDLHKKLQSMLRKRR